MKIKGIRIFASVVFASVFLTSLGFTQDTSKKLPEIPVLSIDKSKQNAKDASKDAKETTTQERNIELLKSADTNATKNERDPFSPVITPKVSGQITNAPKLNLFTKTELNLPSTARKIKKIILEYQNLNGSITTLEKELEGDIDWHFPLILSQEVQPESVEIPDMQEVVLQKAFDIKITKNTINIATEFPLLRDFTLASPTRLVLDFNAPKDKKGAIKEKLKDSFAPLIPTIKEIKLTTHLDFYRVTLRLDGQYKYTLKTDAKKGEYFIALY